MIKETETLDIDARWQAVRDALKARQRALREQINAYPPPIPACDAQFNHLLDQRRALAEELRDLDALRPALTTRGEDVLAAFLRTSRFVGGDGIGEAFRVHKATR